MSATDPSLDCDCYRKSLRNVRIISVLVAIVAIIVRRVAFADGTEGEAVFGIVFGLAAVTYGVTTMFDETATFPKWLYAVIAVGGAVMGTLWGSTLL